MSDQVPVPSGTDTNAPPPWLGQLSEFAKQPPPPADEITLKNAALDVIAEAIVDAQVYYLANAAKILKELGEPELADGCMAKLRSLFNTAP